MEKYRTEHQERGRRKRGKEAGQGLTGFKMWQNHDFYPTLITHEISLQNVGQKVQKKMPHPMFPSLDRKSVFDDYGEVLFTKIFIL